MSSDPTNHSAQAGAAQAADSTAQSRKTTGDTPQAPDGQGPVPGDAQGGTQQQQQQPSEEELMAAYEAEMSRISSADMVLQATVSLLNIGGYRLGSSGSPAAGGHSEDGERGSPGAGRDLEQVRDAIDAVRALLPILERRRPGELRPLRDALSHLQMAYAREASADSATATGASSGASAQSQPRSQSQPQPQSPTQPQPQSPTGGKPAEERESGQPGPAEASGRLWVPGR